MKKTLALTAFLALTLTASAQGWNRQPTPNDTLRSTIVLPDGNVLFQIYAPKASQVSVSGDLPWDKPVKFEKADNGVWKGVCEGLADGCFRYSFTVDGVKVQDPKAPLSTEQASILTKGEGYIKNAPSPENLEQTQAMIDAIWGSYAAEIAEGRGMSVEAVDEAIDGLKLNLPEDFLREGFVDELLDREGLENKLADLAVVESFKKLKSFTLSEYISAKVMPNTKVKNKIAILYADGNIIEGEGKQNVAGDYFSREIAKVRADSTVKAVVFRVNSPGGSVLASEKIKAGIELLKKEKPVVASYGNYAASGGYWISNDCDKIYSDATTLTGSIGVFSMIPDISKTVKDLAHLNIVTVGSSKHADMYSMMRPLDQDELDYMQASVESIYDRFVNIVAEGRGLEPDFVDSIAQGRVWAGSDALKIGLVDEIGTLEDAIKWAAAAAGDADLAAWNVVEYPKPLSQMEMMREMLGQRTPGENIFAGTPFEDTASMFLNWYARVKKNPADVTFARIPYVIDIR